MKNLKLYEEYSVPDKNDFEIKIGFFGDVGCRPSQLETVISDDPFKYIKKWLDTFDFKVANLETTFSGKTSDFPRFSSPDEFAKLLSKNFDLLLFANNHIMDGGESGLTRTKKIVKKSGIPYIGLDDKTLKVNIKGKSFCFINSTTSVNGKASGKGNSRFLDYDKKDLQRLGVNVFDGDNLGKLIADVRDDSDFIIPLIHQRDIEGGIKEIGMNPNRVQKSRLESLIYDGADVVVGGHPHEFQGGKIMEDGKICIWSLGNFFSAMTNPDYLMNSGCVMIMRIDKSLSPRYTFLPVFTCQEQGKNYVIPLSQAENDKIDFISQEEIDVANKKLTEIREILNKCNLKEEIAEIDF